MCRRLWGGFFDRSFKKNGKKLYLEHCEEMRRPIPKERLLEYQMKERWVPLCEILCVSVPDWEFPRVNETKTFDDRFKVVMKLKIVRALKVAAPWISAAVVGADVAFRWGWF